MTMMMAWVEQVASPLGGVVLVTDDRERVLALEWVDHEARLRRLLEARWGRGRISTSPRPRPSLARRAVEAYFGGDVTALDPLAVETGGTPFQRAVWDALRQIPVGETISYAELARRVGRPNAVRAVARANATNPISLVVACHRVVGADGALTGYAGGLERKRWLLEHEHRHATVAAAAAPATA